MLRKLFSKIKNLFHKPLAGEKQVVGNNEDKELITIFKNAGMNDTEIMEALNLTTIDYYDLCQQIKAEGSNTFSSMPDNSDKTVNVIDPNTFEFRTVDKDEYREFCKDKVKSVHDVMGDLQEKLSVTIKEIRDIVNGLKASGELTKDLDFKDVKEEDLLAYSRYPADIKVLAERVNHLIHSKVGKRFASLVEHVLVDNNGVQIDYKIGYIRQDNKIIPIVKDRLLIESNYLANFPKFATTYDEMNKAGLAQYLKGMEDQVEFIDTKKTSKKLKKSS